MKSSALRACSKFIALLIAASMSMSNHRECCLSVSLPLLASSKRASAREVLGEKSDGGNSGPEVGGGLGVGIGVNESGESCSSSDGLSDDAWLEDGDEW